MVDPALVLGVSSDPMMLRNRQVLGHWEPQHALRGLGEGPYGGHKSSKVSG